MVRTVVLGAGAAGERQARALSASAGRCSLLGAYDPDPAAAEALAASLGVPVVENLEATLESADAAVVCGTLEQRLQLARTALERGLDVLVQPPLAPAPDQAHGLLSAIVRAPRRPVAMVAHEQHFDPTIRALRELIADQTVLSVHVERLDPVDLGRTPETDVVHDLMLHDLQLVLSLSEETIAATQAAGRRVRRTGPIDHAQALLVLEDDVVVSLVASRAGAARVRRVTVVTSHAHIVADLETRTLEAVRTATFAGGRHDALAQRIVVPALDPLETMVDTFLRCVERRTSPEPAIGTTIACQEAATAILKRIELIAHRPAARRGPLAA